MTAPWLPLLAIIPLLAAAITIVARGRALDRVLLVAVPVGTMVAGIVLSVLHRTYPVLAHQVGNFVPGVAIVFVSDAFSALMLTVTGLATTICTWFLIATKEDRFRFATPLLLMLTAGVNGALLTGDMFNLFVFIEVMLLPSYALIAITGTWARIAVGRTFVLVNLLTSTILLVGVGFVYAVAGTVNLASLAGRAVDDHRLGLAVSVVLLALLVKSAAVPVHSWLPRSYPNTSAGIMALFSGVHTKVALYAVLRVYTTLWADQPAPWAIVLAVVIIVTILLGALATYGEARIRTALAFQMISGVGHILLGIGVLTALALGAGIFYMVHHIITMGGLLLLAGAIEHTYGTARYDRLSGLLRRDRAVAVLFALGLLSLIGLPPMSGLWGKIALVHAVGSAGGTPAWFYIGAVIVASFISMLALQRMWTEVFWGPPMDTYRPDHMFTGRGKKTKLPEDVRIPARLILPGAALIGVSFAMFVGSAFVLPMAEGAGASLMDVRAYVQAVLP